VVSTPGQGSTFSLVLPVQERPEPLVTPLTPVHPVSPG
jgi:hypothetical protein